MLKTTSFYEIVSAQTNEVLVDGLTFEDMAEQFSIYQEFYGQCEVLPCVRNIITHERRIITRKQQYHSAWINYFEELLQAGNLEWS